MDVTRFALEKRVITTVAIVLVTIGGVGAYRSLPRAEDPGFEIRQARVTTFFPGASPDRVEQLVTDKIEKKIQEIPELDYVTSESKTGLSVIVVSIQERYSGMRPIWDNLRRKIEDVAPELPDGIRGPFVNDEFGDVFGVIVMLTGEGYSYAELKEIADEVRDGFLRLGDVAKVDIYGAQDERVFIEYNNARLAELGLSPVQLSSILESQNIIISGGDVTLGNEKIVVEPSGNFETVEDLRRSVIRLPGRAELFYLEDIARITRGYIDPPRSKMHCSGTPCLGLALSMRAGGNIIELGDQVKALLGQLRAQYPVGVDFEVVAFQPEIVERKVNDFVVNVLQSVAIVLLVMLVMLGLRTGLVVASLIPTTMVVTLLVMSFLEIGLDQMSLASLIIALGMLVDNAIVMSESIMVQMSAGKPAKEAAIGSARELRVPLLTSSLTTAAAFLPIYLAESAMGEYTAPLFLVVTIALLSSWVLSLTMTPLLCVSFLRVTANPEEGSFDSAFYRAYRGFLLRIVRRPLLSVAVTVGLFLAALWGLSYVPVIFFPPSDKAILQAELELPLGTSIEHSEEVVAQIEEFVGRELAVSPARPEGIVNWAAFIGQGAPRFQLSYAPEPPSPNYSFLLVNTSSRDVIEQLIPKLETFCRERFPDLDATFEPLALGSPVDAPVQVRVSGQDTGRLFQLVDQVKAKLEEIPGAKNIRDDWGQRTKKIFVRIDPERARLSGVSNQDIAISLQTAMSGIESTEFREEDETIPVILRSAAADRQDIGKLESLNVYSQATGRSVPLKQVAETEVVWGPAVIHRRNRLRTVTINAQTLPGVTPNDITGAAVPWLDEQSRDWGVGYYYELGGEAESSGKANQAILEQLPIAGLLIALLLVVQFNSLVRPLIIVLTIPLALIGVTIGLLVTNQYQGFMPYLGIISLAGVVINNAIVLLDRIKLEVEENGREPARAVIEAAQRRLRPILLTTATTVGGLLPLWFSGGPLWEAMAIAIIFGLLFATVLTLGVVPVLYSIFFRVSFKEFSY